LTVSDDESPGPIRRSQVAGQPGERTARRPQAPASTVPTATSQDRAAAALTKNSAASAVLAAILKASSQGRAAAALMKNSVASAILTAALKALS